MANERLVNMIIRLGLEIEKVQQSATLAKHPQHDRIFECLNDAKADLTRALHKA